MVKKKIPETIEEIAKEFREEKPLYMCSTCTRETKYGVNPIYFGHIGAAIREMKCPYCGKQLCKIKGGA